jgi:hypothetical protein
LTTLLTTGQLLASQPDEDLVLNYVLLPYGQEGSTSLGKVTASANTITLPQDPASCGINMEHEAQRPVGFFASLTDSAEQLLASVRFLPTTAGRDAYTEAKLGARRGISVEIANPVIRAGKLLAGALSGAGVCVKPAYPDALMIASDHGELAAQAQELADNAQALAESLAAEQPDNPTDPATPNNAGDTVPQPTITASEPQAPGNTPLTATTTVRESGMDLLTAALADNANAEPHVLMAALSGVTSGDVFDVVATPNYAGELWTGRDYAQRFMPLIGHADLTSTEIIQWGWDDEPDVFDYAGDLAEVTSNPVTAKKIPTQASRLASAHLVDRIHSDFRNPAFWDSFYKARAKNYAKKMDAKALAAIQAAAGTASTVPAGSTPFKALIRGARQVLEFGVPTFAIVGGDYYEEMLDTLDTAKLAFLQASLGLEGGSLENFQIVGAPDSVTSMAGQVIVGAKQAVVAHELPGAPIRVEAQDIAHGGITTGVFGYYAFQSEAQGIKAVKIAAGA